MFTTKGFLWIRRHHFSQKVFPEKLKFFTQHPKRKKIHNFYEKNSFLQKDSYGNEEFDFDACTYELLPEHRKILAHCPNMTKRYNFLKEINSSQNFLPDM